jgi:hypothetical protein
MPALEGGEISHACTHNRNRVTVWTVVDDDREQVDA